MCTFSSGPRTSLSPTSYLGRLNAKKPYDVLYELQYVLRAPKSDTAPCERERQSVHENKYGSRYLMSLSLVFTHDCPMLPLQKLEDARATAPGSRRKCSWPPVHEFIDSFPNCSLHSRLTTNPCTGSCDGLEAWTHTYWAVPRPMCLGPIAPELDDQSTIT